MINLSNTAKIRTDVVHRKVQDEEVILDLTSGTYFGLNPMGTHIFGLMKKGLSLEKILAKVTEEFDVEEKTARADILQLAKKLEARGLIEIQ